MAPDAAMRYQNDGTEPHGASKTAKSMQTVMGCVAGVLQAWLPPDRRIYTSVIYVVWAGSPCNSELPKPTAFRTKQELGNLTVLTAVALPVYVVGLIVASCISVAWWVTR